MVLNDKQEEELKNFIHHIQSKHKTVTKSQSAQVVTFISGLLQVAQNIGQVKYPDASSPGIPGIPVSQTDYDACL